MHQSSDEKRTLILVCVLSTHTKTGLRTETNTNMNVRFSYSMSSIPSISSQWLSKTWIASSLLTFYNLCFVFPRIVNARTSFNKYTQKLVKIIFGRFQPFMFILVVFWWFFIQIDLKKHWKKCLELVFGRKITTKHLKSKKKGCKKKKLFWPAFGCMQHTTAGWNT